ncbi:MAG: hypothetical protein JO180_03055 [Gemmatirosa sp.]|nr:hypothetical protein [Gemmatirosa sp.]
MSDAGRSAGRSPTRAVVVPAAALHALRAAVLDGPDGDGRLRDAGYAAGVALFDDFAAEVAHRYGVAPSALPLGAFAAALAEHLEACGWGAVHVAARPGDATIRVSAADWLEGELDAGAPYPACHFSTGLLAGCFGRAAARPLAVLEVACRSAGAQRCEFAVGSAAVLDALWRARGLEGRDQNSGT